MSLDESGKTALDAHLKQTVNDRRVPAAWMGVTNAKEELYFGCGGERVFGKPEEGMVDEHTILQLYSTTKFVTAIAALQLVEQGLIGLEDWETLYKHCPEFNDLQILEGYTDGGKEIMTKPRGKITLRMLLNHTAGFVYPFNSPLIARYDREHKIPPMLGPSASIESYLLPLAFEPGTRFQYGIGIDWAGHLVSRISGLTLEEYFKEHIWKACGIKSISFHPPRNWKKDMMAMTRREPVHTGNIKVMEDTEGRPMGRTYETDEVGPIYSGGGGLFGTARDYLTFLRHVLASASASASASANSNVTPLIKPETFKLLFTDSLPDDPKIRAGLAEMATGQCIHDPALLTKGTGDHIGYGPALLINKKESKWGRKAMSGFWDGAAKTMFWLDPESGIAAICHTNLLSHNPDPWNGVYNQFERILYDHLV